MISIVDYGACNLSSIFNMLKQIGVKSKIINTPDEVVKSEFIILPGVGNFENGIQNLKHKNLDLALKEANQNKINILGICLGMHLMFEKSEEGNKPGLGLLKGKVKKFNSEKFNIQVPHMGWNYVDINKKSKFYFNDDKKLKFYFAHSFYVECHNDLEIAGTTEYGFKFCSIVENENLFGVQFHPEKSHNFGKKLLKNIIKNVIKENNPLSVN